MSYVVEFLFVFAFCCTAGWVLEVIYRSIESKSFINPGFMSGCCLPIYGAGGLALYMLCLPANSLISEPGLRLAAIFIGGSIVMTVIEFIGGTLALKIYNLKLWDYSDRKFNYKGLICLRFSIYWGICCLVFYLLFYSGLNRIAVHALESYGWVLLTGFYYGIFSVDLAESMHLASKLKEYSKTIKATVHMEHIKSVAREALELKRNKPIKLMLFHHGTVKEYLYDVKRRTYEKLKQIKEE